MNAASLFATWVLIWGTTWYAITLQLAATSPAVGVALRFSLAAALIFLWCVARGHRLRLPRVAHACLALMDRTRATMVGIALAVAGDVLALHRPPVKFLA